MNIIDHVFGTVNLSMGDENFPPITVYDAGDLVGVNIDGQRMLLPPRSARRLARLLLVADDFIGGGQ